MHVTPHTPSSLGREVFFMPPGKDYTLSNNYLMRTGELKGFIGYKKDAKWCSSYHILGCILVPHLFYVPWIQRTGKLEHLHFVQITHNISKGIHFMFPSGSLSLRQVSTMRLNFNLIPHQPFRTSQQNISKVKKFQILLIYRRKFLV